MIDVSAWREHQWIGGPPTARLRRMQIQHEARARRLGADWTQVDLRAVYKNRDGVCGICGQHVQLHKASFDHIVPLSRGGAHSEANLQPAHSRCNSLKGDRLWN